MDIKSNLARNLVLYRKASNLTQAEFASKLNYSDKAVSKWERGESVPDLEVLKNIADIYGTTIDRLISEPKEKAPSTIVNLSKKRLIISLCAIALVWLVATASFSFLHIIIPSFVDGWMSFIYAIPVTFFVLIILTSVWGKNLTNMILMSVLVWTTLLAVYLSIKFYSENPSSSLWMIFLIGIPVQILVVLFFSYKKIFKKVV